MSGLIVIPFNGVREKINQIRHSRLARQTGVYSLMQVFSLGMGFLINVFLAKEMGVDQFGIYSFAVAVMGVVGIFFEFGFFSTAAKILADNQDPEEERHWLGAFFCFFLLISSLMGVCIFVLSYYIDDIFNDKIGNLLSQICFLSFVYILPSFMELVLKGNNKIYALSGFNFLQRFIGIVLIVVLYFMDQVRPLTVFYVMGVAFAFAFFYIYFSMKPRFDRVFSYMKRCFAYNQEYGWAIYWGRIAGAAAYNIDKLLISYFSDARTVGLYTMAQSCASPKLTDTNAQSIAMYRQLAVTEIIPLRFIKRNLQALGASALIMVFAGYLTLVLYLSGGYVEAFHYLLILAVVMCFQGAYGLYNTWLAGHGYAKIMRNIAVRIGIMDVVSNFLLIMWLGGYGGCLAALLDMSYSYYLYKKAYDGAARDAL